MRYIVALFLCWGAVSGPAVFADDQVAVNELLDGFHAAAASSAFDDYFDRFADDAYFLGTDAAERWSVAAFKDYARPAFSEGRGWKYTVVSRNLEEHPGDEVFWFDEVLINDALGKCRGTGVILKQRGEWRIAHYSLSLLIPNGIADHVGRLSRDADGL